MSQQPGWGVPQQSAPQPPKKSSAGKIIGFGCLGATVAGILLAGGCAVLVAGSGPSDTGTDDKAAPAASGAPKESRADKTDGKPANDGPEGESAGKGKVVIKVWGDAPGGVDITYGSDTENLQGKGLPLTKTLKRKDDAMYYMVNAQLQGGGDIHCSVTVDGETKKGHAQGGYNICNAQLSDTGFGWD